MSKPIRQGDKARLARVPFVKVVVEELPAGPPLYFGRLDDARKWGHQGRDVLVRVVSSCHPAFPRGLAMFILPVDLKRRYL